MRVVSRGSCRLILAIALVTSAGVTATQRIAAQEATPADAECPATTPEQHVALITAYIESWNDPESDFDLATVYATDHEHLGANERLYEGATAWLESQRALYPDLAVTIDEIVADEDTVAAMVTWSGTQAGDDPRFGFPATGVHAEWESAIFYRMECGKIAESWSLADNLDRLRDVGAITDDEMRSVDAEASPVP